MHPAIEKMLAKHDCQSVADYVNALREILQSLALLGLWRAKFFEHAAFYGGTALRMLYGHDRFSEDLDFSLLTPTPHFSMEKYGKALQQELASFGFHMHFEQRLKTKRTAIQSAFMKVNTLEQLMVIDAEPELIGAIYKKQKLTIKLEVDIDPPLGFDTQMSYLYQPILFAVKSYSLPDLFAGKLHAILCRQWKNRVKGRDWYDLIWFVSHYPQLHLEYLEERLRQSGHYEGSHKLTHDHLLEMLTKRIETLDIQQAKEDIRPFIADSAGLVLWSKVFFLDVIGEIKVV